MEVNMIPGEEELAFVANQDNDDAEDASSGSRKLATMVEAAAETVELDARAVPPPCEDGDSDRTPRDTMEFKSYEEVLNFYKRYALHTVFGICVKKSYFTKANLCRRLQLVCEKWSNGKEDACYQARPTPKTKCQATVDGVLRIPTKSAASTSSSSTILDGVGDGDKSSAY